MDGLRRVHLQRVYYVFQGVPTVTVSTVYAIRDTVNRSRSGHNACCYLEQGADKGKQEKRAMTSYAQEWQMDYEKTKGTLQALRGATGSSSPPGWQVCSGSLS